ncbi:MAG: tRNA 2-thiouridine(34) synthase MnmA [Bacillota bacterium]|nr:MAG: tRNA 2-thiouridine(34) synthase MnmA [Bacillota bacterium]
MTRSGPTTGARVAVALSGGVDSAVTAALLLKAGHEVFGLTMTTGFDAVSAGGELDHPAGGLPHVAAAAGVARQLGIPHQVVDVRDTFRQVVVEPFCRLYREGLTPNPCLACNRFVKFGRLLETALDMGAGHLATGHYARVAKDAAGLHHLFKGRDPAKDQSYVLYGLSQDQLSHVMFPLGGMEKAEVKVLAARMGLQAAVRPESQDICFITGEGHADFIETWSGTRLAEGSILDTAGRRLGTHRGLARYTVGQRRGLGLGGPHALYVVALIPEANALVVGSAHEAASRWLSATGATFVSGSPPPAGARLAVRLRYRARETTGVVSYPSEDPAVFHVSLDVPHRAAAPGQAAVLYRGEEVVGGGIIARTEALERALSALSSRPRRPVTREASRREDRPPAHLQRFHEES